MHRRSLVVLLFLGIFFLCGIECASKYAYTTIFYEGTPKDAEYLLGARVMIRSLKRTGTKHDIVVLVSPNVQPETKRIFRADGAIVLDVPNIPNPFKKMSRNDQKYQSRFEFTLNKLYMWNLTQYERVVYMDADNIALHNPDELFTCGHFCAVFMNPCNFHTGLLVIKPDENEFTKMLDTLSHNARSYDGADQGFLTSYFDFKEMGGAPMFDPMNPQSDAPLLRLPPGYNLNALWYYEHGNWNLYCCHPRFAEMRQLPGVSMTFPVAPFIKPWYWWPYLILDDNWQTWQNIRTELGESHAHVVLLVGAILLSGLILAVWLVAYLLPSPCLGLPGGVGGRRHSRKTERVLAYLVETLGRNNVGLALGVLCVGLSCGLPYLLLPGTLPPKWGWTLYVLSQYVLNYILLLLLSSLIAIDANKQPSLKDLLRSTLRSLVPSMFVVLLVVLICLFGLYPRTMFHLGKIVLVFQCVSAVLVMQVFLYRRIINSYAPKKEA